MAPRPARRPFAFARLARSVAAEVHREGGDCRLAKRRYLGRLLEEERREGRTLNDCHAKQNIDKAWKNLTGQKALTAVGVRAERSAPEEPTGYVRSKGKAKAKRTRETLISMGRDENESRKVIGWFPERAAVRDANASMTATLDDFLDCGIRTSDWEGVRWRDSHGASSGIRRMEILLPSHERAVNVAKELNNKGRELGMTFTPGRTFKCREAQRRWAEQRFTTAASPASAPRTPPSSADGWTQVPRRRSQRTAEQTTESPVATANRFDCLAEEMEQLSIDEGASLAGTDVPVSPVDGVDSPHPDEAEVVAPGQAGAGGGRPPRSAAPVRRDLEC